MLSEFEIRKISQAVVEQLTTDERFMKCMASLAPKQTRLVSLPTAAELLGVSRSWMYHHAEHFRKVKGPKENAPYRFNISELFEDYQKIIQQ